MRLGSIVRIAGKLALWPLLVIAALNIENAADLFGLSKLLPENWEWIMSAISTIQSIATSDWIVYPALFFGGMTVYEWILTLSEKTEIKKDTFGKFFLKNDSASISDALAKKGINRRLYCTPKQFRALNRRLKRADLPTIPEFLSENEEINQHYSIYLHLISSGNFHSAKRYIEVGASIITITEDQTPQSPPNTAQRIQP